MTVYSVKQTWESEKKLLYNWRHNRHFRSNVFESLFPRLETLKNKWKSRCFLICFVDLLCRCLLYSHIMTSVSLSRHQQENVNIEEACPTHRSGSHFGHIICNWSGKIWPTMSKSPCTRVWEIHEVHQHLMPLRWLDSQVLEWKMCLQRCLRLNQGLWRQDLLFQRRMHSNQFKSNSLRHRIQCVIRFTCFWHQLWDQKTKAKVTKSKGSDCHEWPCNQWSRDTLGDAAIKPRLLFNIRQLVKD